MDKRIIAFARAHQHSYDKIAYFREVMERFEGTEKEGTMEEEFVYIIQEYDYLSDDSVIRLVCKTKEIAERNREEMEND